MINIENAIKALANSKKVCDKLSRSAQKKDVIAILVTKQRDKTSKN